MYDKNDKIDKCCGTCKWHKYQREDESWICVNEDSEFCSDWTDYEGYCDDWEARR